MHAIIFMGKINIRFSEDTDREIRRRMFAFGYVVRFGYNKNVVATSFLKKMGGRWK